VGAQIGLALNNEIEKRIADSVLSAIATGRMLVVLKDSLGRSCDSWFNPIPENELHGKWVTPRLLVPSGKSLNPSAKSLNKIHINLPGRLTN
jgi:hypothetical protein